MRGKLVLALALTMLAPAAWAKVSYNFGGAGGGSIRPGDDSTTCSSTIAGAIRYNSGALGYCNGTAWTPLAAGNASGTTVAAGVSGSIQFNSGGALAGRNDLLIDPAGNMYVGNNRSTDAALNIGENATGNHYAYVDLVGDATYTDYGLRLIRDNVGANGPSSLISRGTGALQIWTQDSAPIRFLTSGTEAMRIMPGGNVGIGTAAPQSMFQVGSNQYAASFGAANGAPLYFWNYLGFNSVRNTSGNWVSYSDGANNGGTVMGGDAAGGLNFYTYPTSGTGTQSFTDTQFAAFNRMKISPAGNVGIGTTAPATKLDVSGLLRAVGLQTTVGSGASGNVHVAMYDGSGFPIGIGLSGTRTGSNVGGDFNIWRYADDGSFIGSGLSITRGSGVIYIPGNVGIGTTTPGYALQVSGTGLFSDTNLNYQAGKLMVYKSSGFAVPATTGTTDGAVVSRLSAGSVALDYGIMVNGTGWLQQRRIDDLSLNPPLVINPNGGNVGIGTTNPLSTLHVKSAGVGEVRAEGSNYAKYMFVANAAGTDQKKWQLYSYNSGSYNALNLTALNDAENSDVAAMQFVRGTGTAISSVIFPSGNVGIGNANPGARLTVNGSSGANAIEAYSAGTVSGVYGTNSSTGGYGVYGANSNSGAVGTLGGGNGFGVLCVTGSCGGNANWTNTSDIRLKERVETLSNSRGLALIDKLRPVTYHWKDKKRDAREGLQIGFIAQEVEKQYPEMVLTDPSSTIKSLAYSEITAPLVKAVQELKAQNDNLRSANEKMQRQLDAICKATRACT